MRFEMPLNSTAGAAEMAAPVFVCTKLSEIHAAVSRGGKTAFAVLTIAPPTNY